MGFESLAINKAWVTDRRSDEGGTSFAACFEVAEFAVTSVDAVMGEMDAATG